MARNWRKPTNSMPSNNTRKVTGSPRRRDTIQSLAQQECTTRLHETWAWAGHTRGACTELAKRATAYQLW
eukprot:4875502-Alexandrium_andersonii.AAC.1